MSLWLIGAGPMAQAYGKVLIAQNVPFEVIGRGDKSAKEFMRMTGKSARMGGLEDALQHNDPPESAIVAVGIEHLTSTTAALCNAGTRRIMVEKPGGLNVKQLETLHQDVLNIGSEVWLGYNRRFYASTLEAERAIAEDGGVTSVQFEFTEWSHVIRPLVLSQMIKDRWIIGNSSHVLDLVFHLCGVPVDWKGWRAGSLDWHPSSARFCGSGVTNRGVLFSYHADWEAPGRWGVEIMTRKRRLILRPMEQLHVTSLGSVKIDIVKIDDQLDQDYKPGLYRQTSAFLSGDTEHMCSLEHQICNARLYCEMAGYPID